MSKAELVNRFFNHVWPVDYKKGTNREETIRITLKSFLFYIIFLMIATTVIISMIPPLVYIFTKTIKRQFVDLDFLSIEKEPITFDDIRTANDFWMYLSVVAIPNIYASNWSGITNYTVDEKKILFENYVLGTPRLRQLRVRSDSCEIHKHFKERFRKCHAVYSKSNEDTSSNKNFKYNPPESYLIYFGYVSIYGSGGYMEFLGDSKDDSLEMLHKLYEKFWINQNTRVVFMDFTLFNVNLNLFCIVKLIFEFPPSGGVIASSSFLTVKFMRYNNPNDYAIMGLELVYIMYIFYFIIQEIRNCIYYKKKYWTFLWSYVNILIITGSIILIAFNIYKFQNIPDEIQIISENPDKYADMEFIAFWQWIINNIEAILLFLIWIKIFRYLNLSKSMGQLESTLNRCGSEIIVFSLMFFIVFISFALMGYLLFGEQNNHFSSFPKSLMTLLITILGDFDYYSIERDNKILAPIFFTTYIFFVFFVLFNMFLAIITGTFSYVKNDIKVEKSELKISEFLLRPPKKLWQKYSPALFKFKKNEMQMSSYEMINEIKRILELCNFSTSEITRFFEIYNVDENGLDEDNRDNLLKLFNDIKKYKPNPDDNPKKENLTMTAFSSYQERFDNLNIHFRNLQDNMNKLNEQVKQFKPNS